LSSLLRLSALELKTTNRPVAEIAASKDSPSPALSGAVPLCREARIVVSVWRSRTNTSYSNEASTSRSLRLSASDSKATKRPSAEIEGRTESPSAPFRAPVPVWRETSVVVFAWRSRT
jgi:hypothetical protein